LLKGQCLQPWDGRQYSHLCYNDIQPLYSIRQIEAGRFPYVTAELTPTDLVNGGIEYPVLTGLFMWVAGTFVSHDANAYLIVSAIALAPFALFSAYALARMVGWRSLLWAAAPALILYAFHNWDLLVVAAAVGGIWAWKRGQPLWAAVLFGIGGALKIYPIFFLAPLALDRLKRSGVKKAAETALTGAGTFVFINLPFALVNFDGWWATYAFHKRRGPNFDSIWNLRFPGMTPDRLNLVTGGLTLAVFAIALGAGWWRAHREGEFPFLQVAGAMLAGFLLWNKVHSPQYTLWILPFFAVLSVNILWWVAYAAIDLMVYIGVFRFFFETATGAGTDDPAYLAMKYGVYGRAALLAALIVVFLTARRVDEMEPEQASEDVVSHPPPNVATVGEAPA
jgi:uncharacterized membrane protein